MLYIYLIVTYLAESPFSVSRSILVGFFIPIYRLSYYDGQGGLT